MAGRNFRELLEAQWDKNNFVCVGLDSEFKKMPAAVKDICREPRWMMTFNEAIVDATKDLVCAYKPNIAFYAAHGDSGMTSLRNTFEYIREVAPDVPVILDAKRADIGNTNAGYVQEAFDFFGADAITVNPYLGQDALKPFLDRKDKGIFVLCRTSNDGADEFQNLRVCGSELFCHVARHVASYWNENGNCGLVVGATYPDELHRIRGSVDDMPILIPGIGAQGCDLEQTIAAGKDRRGRGMIINSSRGIIFASNGPDFAEAARREAIKLRDQINRFR